MRSRLLVFCAAILVLAPLCVGQATTYSGELDGVPYLIRVPQNWNGTLLVYAYGYAEAYGTPLAPPYVNPDLLLDKGFALAGLHATGSVNIPGGLTDAGWNLEERMQETVALAAAFRDIVGQPRRTIMWGQSMGGAVTLAMIEKFPGLYDGAVALCAPGAGTPRMFDQKVDIALAYRVLFGWKTEWGTPGYLRSDLNVLTEVYPHIVQQLTLDKLWRWEVLRLVNRIPADP